MCGTLSPVLIKLAIQTFIQAENKPNSESILQLRVSHSSKQLNNRGYINNNYRHRAVTDTDTEILILPDTYINICMQHGLYVGPGNGHVRRCGRNYLLRCLRH